VTLKFLLSCTARERKMRDNSGARVFDHPPDNMRKLFSSSACLCHSFSLFPRYSLFVPFSEGDAVRPIRP